jgi:hypothetical protein
LRTIAEQLPYHLKGRWLDQARLIREKGKRPSEFKEASLDTYNLEVIGGNHRRIALQDLVGDPEQSSNNNFKFTEIQLFSGEFLVQYINVLFSFINL